MADYDCDYCQYEKKCGLYEYCCPYLHLFNKTEENILKEKAVLTSAINDLKSVVSKLEMVSTVDLEDTVNSLKHDISNIEDMYSDETISKYKELI